MKNTRDELIKVGAYIESKNGVEFSVRIDNDDIKRLKSEIELFYVEHIKEKMFNFKLIV